MQEVFLMNFWFGGSIPADVEFLNCFENNKCKQSPASDG